MAEAKEEETFLTDERRFANKGKLHLYEKYRLHPRSTSQSPDNLFERVCGMMVAGNKTKDGDELEEVSKEEIEENEEVYCGNCLNVVEGYDG